MSDDKVLDYMEKRLDRIEAKLDNLSDFKSKLMGMSGTVSVLISVAIQILGTIFK